MNKIYIGYTTMTHGIRGELKLYTDFSLKEKILKPGFPIYIDNVLHTITHVRPHKNHYLLLIDDKKDINLVEEFRNKKIFILESDLHLNEKEYILESIIGYCVEEENITLGKVKEIRYNKNGILLFVEGNTKFYIPLCDAFVLKVLKKEQKVIVQNTKGLRI